MGFHRPKRRNGFPLMQVSSFVSTKVYVMCILHYILYIVYCSLCIVLLCIQLSLSVFVQIITFLVDYQPRKVERVQLANIVEEHENICKLRAEIIFEPVQGNARKSPLIN